MDSFNEYFAMRNLPRTEKKPEKKTVKKPAAKNEEKTEGKNVKPVSEKPSFLSASAARSVCHIVVLFVVLIHFNIGAAGVRDLKLPLPR